jgi:hypothetical protein
MTTLTPVLEGFELDNPTVEERLLNLERALGLAPTAEDPLAQYPVTLMVKGLLRRVRALEDAAGLKRPVPGIKSLGAPPVEP